MSVYTRKVLRRANGRVTIYKANYGGSREAWRELSERVKKRDGYTCRKCGTHKSVINKRGGSLECDHIIPRSKGGTDKMTNLWALCDKCHSRRPFHTHLHKRKKIEGKLDANPKTSPEPSSSSYRIGSLSDF